MYLEKNNIDPGKPADRTETYYYQFFLQLSLRDLTINPLKKQF